AARRCADRLGAASDRAGDHRTAANGRRDVRLRAAQLGLDRGHEGAHLHEWHGEAITVKALVFQAPNEAVVTDIGDPEIGPDEVLVKSHAVGICHSDFELYEGRYIIPVSYPVIPGHEWCGEVVETGTAVRGLQAGDAVVGECVVGPAGRDHFGFSLDGADPATFKARGVRLHQRPLG